MLLPAWRRLPPDLRPKRHTDHKSGGRKGFAWTEYRDLIAAHQQPDGPIVLIWDNLNVHKDRRMRAFIDAQDWITAHAARLWVALDRHRARDRPYPGRQRGVPPLEQDVVTGTSVDHRRTPLLLPRPPERTRADRPTS